MVSSSGVAISTFLASFCCSFQEERLCLAIIMVAIPTDGSCSAPLADQSAMRFSVVLWFTPRSVFAEERRPTLTPYARTSFLQDHSATVRDNEKSYTDRKICHV